MTWKKGESGNPTGRFVEKQFLTAETMTAVSAIYRPTSGRLRRAKCDQSVSVCPHAFPSRLRNDGEKIVMFSGLCTG